MLTIQNCPWEIKICPSIYSNIAIFFPSMAYTHLLSGEKFLMSAEQLKGDGYVSLIFMSNFGKLILNSSRYWYMDGTFSTVPDEFSQLYTIFGTAGENTIIPCVYM